MWGRTGFPTNLGAKSFQLNYYSRPYFTGTKKPPEGGCFDYMVEAAGQ